MQNKYFYLILGIWNLIVMLLYGIDKQKAKKKKRRISEKTLLICSLLGGGIGGFLGMIFFRHKTKHLLFKILVPIGVGITIVLIYCIYTYL